MFYNLGQLCLGSLLRATTTCKVEKLAQPECEKFVTHHTNICAMPSTHPSLDTSIDTSIHPPVQKATLTMKLYGFPEDDPVLNNL